eukprot:jgi/Picre1/31745/NNA_007096.t1
MAQESRFYEERFPEVDDVVMVQVRSIAEMGAYVSLLEYGNIEGMILFSELSRRRIRSVQKLIKVGQDVAKCEDKFAKSKLVHTIMRHVAETTGTELEDLYTQIGWPLYKMFGHAHDAFRQMITDEESDAVFERLKNEYHGGKDIPILTPDVKEGLLKNIRRRLTPQPIKIRADVEMTCFNYDGIEHIKAAMKAAQACNTRYELLNEAVVACQKSIESNKGQMRVKEAARAVSEKEERALQEELEAAEAANREVAGDSDSEGDYEEGMSMDVNAGPALSM